MLVIGDEGGQLLALCLTSRDHDVDAAQEHARRSGVDGHRHRRLGPQTPSRARSGSTGCCASTPPAYAVKARRSPKDVFDAVLEAARPYL